MQPSPLRFSTVLLLLLAFAASPSIAQPGPASAFSFLRLEPSARAAALGGAFGAIHGDDVNTLFFNPALLNESMHRSASFSYLNHLGEINAGFLAYSRHKDELGTFGAGLRFVGWGNTEGYDEQGESTGDFGASDAALTLSYARAADSRLSYGASLHALRSSIESYGATALAADLGAAYHLSEARMTFSASLNNIGVVLNSLGSLRDELPMDLRVGTSKRLEYVPFLITVTGYNLNRIGEDTAEGNTLNDVMRHVAFGGEFQFSDAFNIRFGYNHRRHQDLKLKSRLDMAGFGAGFGIKVSSIRVDYAFNSWSSLGGLHQFTLRTVI